MFSAIFEGIKKYRNEWDSINQESEHIGIRDLALSSKEFQKMSSTYTSSSLLKKFLLSLRLKTTKCTRRGLIFNIKYLK